MAWEPEICQPSIFTAKGRVRALLVFYAGVKCNYKTESILTESGFYLLAKVSILSPNNWS